MEFRPCIDIHNGKVKQIVGGSLRDAGDQAQENYVAQQDAAFFARLYREAGLKGGHIILLNSPQSEYYDESRRQAFAALKAYPGGLQIGGGITPENAQEYLRAGASHVIVTSYVFCSGCVRYDRLEKLADTVGRERLVLDLSCKKTQDGYRIMTDRWQKMTREKVTAEFMDELSAYCGEFLVHAVDVEGQSRGIERELAGLLGSWDGLPVTYAGGIHNMEDIRELKRLGGNRLNVTIGSALDLFGGSLSWRDVLDVCCGN